MRDKFWRLWCNLNYRLCMVEAYLADNRGERVERGEWLTKAADWQREYIMCGRSLRHG
jgi:hypothetical protein